MRQQRTLTAGATFLACVSLLACGGGADSADQQTGGQAAAQPVENPATLNGRVAFNGAPPQERPIDMRDEPACAERHETGADSRAIAVNDGALQYVFVYISEGMTARPGGDREPVVIDQLGCIYHPRVAGVMTGQPVTFRNSDGLLHNIKAVPTTNRGFNITQPNNMDTQRNFPQPEVMVPIECNVHGWMQAYIGVVDHPYFAVSGADGTFRIDNLPAGTYTLTAWHERLGTQSQQFTVEPNGTADVVFTYDASMAGRPVPLGPPIDPHVHAVATAHPGR